MIRDRVENVQTIIRVAFDLADNPKGGEGVEGAQGAIWYRQAVFDMAGALLWPDRDHGEQRDRLGRLFDAHRALFVQSPD